MSATPLAVDPSPVEPNLDTPLEAWDNEGGRLTPRTDLPNSAGLIPLAARQGLQASLEAKLTKDFIEGQVGNHHNTYAHRLRYLRQDSALLQHCSSDARSMLPNSKS